MSKLLVFKTRGYHYHELSDDSTEHVSILNEARPKQVDRFRTNTFLPLDIINRTEGVRDAEVHVVQEIPTDFVLLKDDTEERSARVLRMSRRLRSYKR